MALSGGHLNKHGDDDLKTYIAAERTANDRELPARIDAFYPTRPARRRARPADGD